MREAVSALQFLYERCSVIAHANWLVVEVQLRNILHSENQLYEVIVHQTWQEGG